MSDTNEADLSQQEATEDEQQSEEQETVNKEVPMNAKNLSEFLMCPACNTRQPVRTSIRVDNFKKDVKQYCNRCNIMLKHAKIVRGKD